MEIQGLAAKAVIWDMDGVIADTACLHFRSWQYAFQKRGVSFSDKDFKHHFGQRNDIIIRDTMGDGVPVDVIEAVAEDKEKYFRREAAGNLKPFPGVNRLLKTLKEKKVPCAVASSAPLENIRLILSCLGMEEYFRAVVYGKEVADGKPSPQIFLLAAQKLGVGPEKCIVIEDAVAGVRAAKRAGMFCIAVTNTHDAQSLDEADMIVNSLEEVAQDGKELKF
jgi:beta-phosphoglucomutase family hydrolase